ncbi:glycosyltransferase family 4 protein [Aeromicrobium sp. zg-Y1362]|nr:glycosyltransferase family 4 protein [Aeromicrobium duanguangcaii]
MVIAPRVPGSPAREEHDGLQVRRFRYFPRRWEDLADGAILENLRARPSRWLQVLPLLFFEFWAVRRAVREFRPDVIHAHWIIPQGFVAALAAPRVPRLLTTLGGDLYAFRRGPMRRVQGWVVRGSAAVTVMNEEMARIVTDLGATDVRVLPMGADLGAFRHHAARDRGQEPELCLLFVGRMVEKKGLAVLLDALARTGPAVRLTVVGDGPLRAELEQRAPDGVVFAGQLGRSGLAAAYARADVVVAPSVEAASGDKDGLPVAMLEAMGSGCAVIASDLPGLNEAVVDGVSGLLTPSGDPAALAAAIDKLDQDRDLLRRLAHAAAERAENYSIEATGDRYVELIRSLR